MQALVCLFGFILPCFSALTAGQPQVQIGMTTLNGLSLPTFGQEFFGGIPFAESPVGNLRFAPPVLKLSPGVPVVNATQFGAACPQRNAPLNEDCLTVNVLRPAGVNESSALPVMVWMYGGGFISGSASIYNASAIVLQSVLRGTPIVYVNLNYRLGPLGFPQGREAERRGATNLGNKDVLAALTWVRENIGAFGGDKEKVTVFGESAGAIIIAELLLNPSFNLARAAILESGSAATNGLVRASAREELWQDFVSGVPECSRSPRGNTFDCLRSASLESLFDGTSFALSRTMTMFPFSPVIDGPGGIIPDLPSRLLTRGRFSRIPMLIGTNLDEGTAFIPTTFNSSSLLRQWLFTNTTPSPVSVFEQNFVVNRILKLYPNIPALGSPFGSGNETFGLDPAFKRASAVFGDVGFTSLRRQLAQVASNRGSKVFAYLFTDSQTLSVPAFNGVSHGTEVLYVYGVPQNGPASVILSRNMIDYWVSFATSLDPNDGRGNASRVTWTRYTPRSDMVMELNSANLRMMPDTFRDKQIGFLNAHPEALLH